MHCARCNGCVVQEQISDFHGTTAWYEVVRCLNCGNIEDATIAANRSRLAHELSSEVPPPPSSIALLAARAIPHSRSRESPDRLGD